MHSSAELTAFLARVAVPTGQYLELRLITPDGHGAVQHFCCTVSDANAVASRASGRANVYVGACPRVRRSGKRDAVTTVVGAWADLDFHSIDTDDRAEAEGIAVYRLERVPQRPTILVHTGNGLQSWWLYNTPLTLSDAQPATYFEAINRGLARLLQGDTVHDIARVLRVPGTLNLPDARKRARGCVPIMARLLHHDGPTHSPDVFQRIAMSVKPRVERVSAKARPLATSATPADHIVRSFEEILASLGSGHSLRRIWRGDRLLRDTSRSGWDMALVNQLVRARVRAEFIPAIVRAFRFGRGELASDAYIALTIAKVEASLGAQHGTN
jgi:hypothetical protein